MTSKQKFPTILCPAIFHSTSSLSATFRLGNGNMLIKMHTPTYYDVMKYLTISVCAYSMNAIFLLTNDERCFVRDDISKKWKPNIVKFRCQQSWIQCVHTRKHFHFIHNLFIVIKLFCFFLDVCLSRRKSPRIPRVSSMRDKSFSDYRTI